MDPGQILTRCYRKEINSQKSGTFPVAVEIHSCFWTTSCLSLIDRNGTSFRQQRGCGKAITLFHFFLFIHSVTRKSWGRWRNWIDPPSSFFYPWSGRLIREKSATSIRTSRSNSWTRFFGDIVHLRTFSRWKSVFLILIYSWMLEIQEGFDWISKKPSFATIRDGKPLHMLSAETDVANPISSRRHFFAVISAPLNTLGFLPMKDEAIVPHHSIRTPYRRCFCGW